LTVYYTRAFSKQLS